MLREELLVYVRRASPSQTRVAAIAAAAPFLAFAAGLPFARVDLPKIPASMPVVDAVLLFGGSVTAALPFVQASVLWAGPFVILTSGYLFAAPIMNIIVLPPEMIFSRTMREIVPRLSGGRRRTPPAACSGPEHAPREPLPTEERRHAKG